MICENMVVVVGFDVYCFFFVCGFLLLLEGVSLWYELIGDWLGIVLEGVLMGFFDFSVF